MKTIKQLLRQPLKTLAGVLMVALAAAVLCVCVGQSIMAGRTEAAIEYRFNTVALLGGDARYVNRDEIIVVPGIGEIPVHISSNELAPWVVDFISSVMEQHPEVGKTVSNPGLASAYLPELTADNVSHHFSHSPYLGIRETAPTYACAILEITVTEIGEPHTVVAEGKLEDGTAVSVERAVNLSVSGTVERVLSLESGYRDPTGDPVRLTLKLEKTGDGEAQKLLDALDLEVGGRYLVYTSHYQDGEWLLKSMIADDLSYYEGENVDWREIDTDKILPKAYMSSSEYPYYYPYKHSSAYLTEEQMQLKDAAVITVRDLALDGSYTRIYHDNGSYPTVDYTRYVTDKAGDQIKISEEEWLARYSVPTMARLEGTAEAFLASEEGAQWRQYLEYTNINHHAFPIIGVEKLGYIADFAKENARIIQGRDFTAEELAAGAKVCILSELVAQINGLEVGDTISPQFYNCDDNDPNQDFISQGKGVTNPWAYKFTGNTEFAGEPEEYTIVGIYRQNNAWGDLRDNTYSFTPNTIFVPYGSVTADMDHSELELFQTLVLHNGTVPEFRALAEAAEVDDLFSYYDQGYTLFIENMTAYRKIADQAVAVGLGVCGVILVLYLLLFPGSQGRTLTTMTALGAKRGQKLRQIILSSAGILLPGSLVGLGVGILLWDKLVAWLAEGAGSTLTLEMDPWVLAAVALAQLALALVLTALLALPMSGHRGIQKRK